MSWILNDLNGSREAASKRLLILSLRETTVSFTGLIGGRDTPLPRKCLLSARTGGGFFFFAFGQLPRCSLGASGYFSFCPDEEMLTKTQDDERAKPRIKTFSFDNLNEYKMTDLFKWT